MKFIPGILFLIFSSFASAQRFPKEFLGKWEGTLEWFKAGKREPVKVRMRLDIAPGDSAKTYTWHLLYGDSASDNRPYIIRPADTSSTHWIIDEGDGILIDQYLVGHRFMSVFQVQNTTITDIYSIENGKMIVEFISSGNEPAVSGGRDEDTSEVRSYPVKSYQRAVLKRIGR